MNNLVKDSGGESSGVKNRKQWQERESWVEDNLDGEKYS
jgi:hypothetical protein